MMKTTKFGALFLISIMALAGVTAGYALWSETLTINGTVGIGEFDVDLEVVAFDETETEEGSEIDAFVTGGNIMTVTITGAYPGITYWVDFKVINSGTVPADFDDWDIAPGTMPADSTITITPDSTAIVSTILLTGEEWDGLLEVTIPESATQGASGLTFTITLAAYQTT